MAVKFTPGNRLPKNTKFTPGKGRAGKVKARVAKAKGGKGGKGKIKAKKAAGKAAAAAY